MSYPYQPESLLAVHQRRLAELAASARLVALARCCRPSRLRTLVRRPPTICCV